MLLKFKETLGLGVGGAGHVDNSSTSHLLSVAPDETEGSRWRLCVERRANCWASQGFHPQTVAQPGMFLLGVYQRKVLQVVPADGYLGVLWGQGKLTFLPRCDPSAPPEML